MEDPKEVFQVVPIEGKRPWSRCFEIHQKRNVDHERNPPTQIQYINQPFVRDSSKSVNVNIDSWKEYVRNVMAKFDEMSPSNQQEFLNLCNKDEGLTD